MKLDVIFISAGDRCCYQIQSFQLAFAASRYLWTYGPQFLRENWRILLWWCAIISGETSLSRLDGISKDLFFLYKYCFEVLFTLFNKVRCWMKKEDDVCPCARQKSSHRPMPNRLRATYLSTFIYLVTFKLSFPNLTKFIYKDKQVIGDIQQKSYLIKCVYDHVTPRKGQTYVFFKETKS